jgi:hypothetical protein
MADAAIIITTVLSGGTWTSHTLGLVIMALIACFAAIIVAARVLMRTIDMRVILECGCVAETDTTEGGHCPVHGPQRIAAYDPSIFKERLNPARSARSHTARLRSIALRVLSATGTVTGTMPSRPRSRTPRR